jgi:hypothetical protein
MHSHKHKTIYLIAGAVAVALVAGAGVYFAVKGIKITPAEPAATEPVPAAEKHDVADPERIAEFEDAINAGDMAKIQGVLGDPTNLIKEGSSCCGPITPAEVITHMDFLKDAGKFNFDQEQYLIKTIKTKNPIYNNGIIGVSDNKKAIIYGINSLKKVNQIMQVSSFENLLK